MADDERRAAPRRRPPRREPARTEPAGPEPARDEPEREQEEARPVGKKEAPRIAAADAARCAASQIAALTDHHPESVIAIEPHDGGWRVEVEVVETRRIPDSADILAVYEVVLQPDGELLSYRRCRRYARGQLQGGSR